MGLGEGTVAYYRAGVADGDTVVLPCLCRGEDLLSHLGRRHGWAGDDLDGDALLGRGNLDVRAADVDHQDFHSEKDTRASRAVARDECEVWNGTRSNNWLVFKALLRTSKGIVADVYGALEWTVNIRYCQQNQGDEEREGEDLKTV